MKLVSKTLAAASAAALALILAGCSVPAGTDGSDGQNQGSSDGQGQNAEDQAQLAALEKYADLEREQIPLIHETYPGVYKDVVVETELPGTIIFKYVYADSQDQTAVAGELDKMNETFKSTADSAIFPALKSSGANGKLTVRYVYENPDGGSIWSKDFQSE